MSRSIRKESLDGRQDEERHPGPSGHRDASTFTELAARIDKAAAGNPSMSEFIERLEASGIKAIPSIQFSGRLNGISYRYQGMVIKGSRIGRAYTALGLRERKGVEFDAGRDIPRMRVALERAGVHDPQRVDCGPRDRDDRRDRVRHRLTGLSADQGRTLAEVGRFRTVAVEDLVKHRYGGNVGRFDADMRVLAEAGLAERRSVVHARSGDRFNVVVLTRRGQSLLKKAGDPRAGGQRFYAGLVKAGEVRHDVGIYRMYQAEAARIEKAGGKIRRVVLDFELKGKVFSEANKRGAEPDYEVRKRVSAEEIDVKVVNGRVVIPDLRVEFETRDQEMDKVDLELTTADYKSSQLRAKAAAGFKLYAPVSAAGSPALQDPEIVTSLISF